MNIIVVEDDIRLGTAIKRALEHLAYTVTWLRTGVEGLEALRDQSVDLVLLDLGLPEKDGIEVITEARRLKVKTPILVMTARDSIESRVRGLDAGADDYMTKPFSLEELVARLRGLLRRSSHLAPPTEDELTVGDLTLDGASHEVTRAGTPISLSSTEFELLRFLMRNPRRALTRTEILDRVWNYDFAGRTSIVDLYISYLRKKIDAGRDPMIHTVRGVGYMLRAPA